ncbi:rod shape-determining protein MreC [Caulobacter sp. CCUG 60055]|uniref:rod shape-determining protein MreC n=2 Tax=Pseudomonadota TaxID=1224 RepID=UPI001FA7DB1C|nr:rod shape-determining protein MreC [Caulobacter sp. CCUG 60055]
MSLRDGPFGDLKVPLTWTAAVALIVAAVAAVAFLMSDRRETLQASAYGASKNVVDTVEAPVGGVISAPVRWAGAGIDGVRGYFFAISENRRLRAELIEARQWRDKAMALEDKTRRYEAILGLKTDPPIPMVAARVVMDARGPFANTRLANAGKEAGVVVGNPVMSERGLVGRVIGVADGASRVLLLTDIASRTPVMIERTNARAILTGDGGSDPRLDYLRGRDPVKAGDRLLTSGDGGVMPRGLPVGTAVKGVDGGWRVRLDSDYAPIDYVRILKFKDFTQAVSEAQLEASTASPPTTQAAQAAAPAAQAPAVAKPAAVKPAAAPKPKPAPARQPETAAPAAGADAAQPGGGQV